MDRRVWRATVQAITQSDILPPGAGEIFTEKQEHLGLESAGVLYS